MKDWKKAIPILCGTIMFFCWAIRIEYLQRDATGWFIHMAALLVCLVAALLIKKIIE